MKTWIVYKSGGERIGTVIASCATKAAKQFMRDNYPGQEYTCSFLYGGKNCLSIALKHNYTIMSDFVITVA